MRNLFNIRDKQNIDKRAQYISARSHYIIKSKERILNAYLNVKRKLY